MDKPAVIFYWVRFAAVLIVVIMAAVAALRRTQPHPARGDLTIGIIGLVGTAIVLFVGRPAANWMLTAGLFVVGIVLGFALAKIRAVVAWLTALALMFTAVMVLFGEPRAVGVGLAVLAFGTALPLGQGLRGLTAKNSATAPAAETPSENPPASGATA
jgi:hypothetical protein